jgi:hypothetical protein
MYLDVMFNRRMTWRHHIKRTEAKAFHMYMRTYSLFKSEHLSANIKLILYIAQIRSVMLYACPTWVCSLGCSPLETTVPAELSSPCTIM